MFWSSSASSDSSLAVSMFVKKQEPTTPNCSALSPPVLTSSNRLSLCPERFHLASSTFTLPARTRTVPTFFASTSAFSSVSDDKCPTRFYGSFVLFISQYTRRFTLNNPPCNNPFLEQFKQSNQTQAMAAVAAVLNASTQAPAIAQASLRIKRRMLILTHR